MSRNAETSSGTSSAIKSVVGIVFVVAMALVVLLIVSASPQVEPFDPRSAQPSGARGLVRVLQAAGADVDDTRTVPDVGDDTRVLVLEDRLNDEQRDALLDFVRAGGIAVVADEASTLHGGAGTDGGADRVVGSASFDGQLPAEREANVDPGNCTIDALTRLRGVFVVDGLLFPVGPNEPQCFTDGPARSAGTSFVIVSEIGDGLVVGLGDNEAFINANLRRSDNAGLMAALLVPESGTDVTFLLGSEASPTVEDVGSGDETLRDLIPTWVWMALTLSAVAFVVFAISRAVNPGRIVSEPIATPLAGSELVSATGNLMERAGHTSRAGWLLLGRLHRDLCRAHNVDVSAPLTELDAVVAQQSGTQPGEIEFLLRRTVSTPAEFSQLSADIHRTRRRVLPGSADDAPAEISEVLPHVPAGTPTDERVSP